MKKALRGEILEKALNLTMKDRNDSYGDPYTDLSCASALMDVYRRHAGKKYDPAHDEAIGRVMMKLARIACGAVGHEDSYVDGAAYLAIAAECQDAGVKAYKDVPFREYEDKFAVTAEQNHKSVKSVLASYLGIAETQFVHPVEECCGADPTPYTPREELKKIVYEGMPFRLHGEPYKTLKKNGKYWMCQNVNTSFEQPIIERAILDALTVG